MFYANKKVKNQTKYGIVFYINIINVECPFHIKMFLLFYQRNIYRNIRNISLDNILTMMHTKYNAILW